MQALLYKEYLVNRQTLFLVALILIGSSLIFADSNQISMIIPLIYSWLLPLISETNEEPNRSDTLMNSLPVTRKKIVLSKHVFSILAALSFFIITILMNVLLPNFTINTITEVLIGLTAVATFLSVYFPIRYLVGPRFLTIGLILFFLILLSVIYPLLNLGARNNYWGILDFITQYSLYQLGFGSLVISILLLTLSYFISSRIYTGKDF